MAIAQAELDAMQTHYKTAVEEWIRAIRDEEALASPAEHNEANVDEWESAAQREEAARRQAKAAKAAYEGALRKEFFGF